MYQLIFLIVILLLSAAFGAAYGYTLMPVWAYGKQQPLSRSQLWRLQTGDLFAITFIAAIGLVSSLSVFGFVARLREEVSVDNTVSLYMLGGICVVVILVVVLLWIRNSLTYLNRNQVVDARKRFVFSIVCLPGVLLLSTLAFFCIFMIYFMFHESNPFDVLFVWWIIVSISLFPLHPVLRRTISWALSRDSPDRSAANLDVS